MGSVTNTNGLRVVTGGQMGTMDIQFVLIKCYNAPFTVNQTSNPYELISDPNDGFSQIIQVVQDFCEIYYIGWPQANSGGETDLTRVIVGINPFTARGLDSETNIFPSATGRWTELETALNDAISISDSEAWFGMPGEGWDWTYNY